MAIFTTLDISCSIFSKDVMSAKAILDAPAFAKESAVARPMPFAAPVMNTERLLKSDLRG